MADRQKLVVVGNGMAGARFVAELITRGGRECYDITVVGEETGGSYNRILLSGVLSGAHSASDIFINPVSWYAEHGVTLRAGIRVTAIDRAGKTAYGADGIPIPYDKLVIATGSSPFVPPMDGLLDDDGAYKPGAFVFPRWTTVPTSLTTPPARPKRPSSAAACWAWRPPVACSIAAWRLT